MFAGQRTNGKQALFQLFQFMRVEIQLPQTLLNARLCVAKFDQGPVQRRQCAIQPPLGAVRRAFQPPHRIPQGALGALTRNCGIGALNIGTNAFGSLHRAAAGV